VAYLHNATEHGVAPLRQLPESSHARLFTGERRADFMDFLRSRLAPGISGAPYADAFLSSRAVPSRQLLAVAAAEIQQRERETSASRFTKAKFRSGRPQVDELIAAARVPVFLLDEHQVVRPGELGTVDDIEAHAQGLGLAVRKVSLDDQFRCGGSDEYLDWVQRLLGLSPGGPRTWPGDPAFGVYVADRPHELEHVLRSRLDAGYGARMTAGFCWPWSEPRSDGSLVPDVVIGDWSRPWNLRSERALGGAPPSSLWATDPAGFGQIGCVYTAQGFEYDWNGVIIGPDLVWRDGGWVAIRSANKDPDFRSRTTVTDLEFERLVRNVYKVLLTRGMIGTVICSGDDETRAMLRSLVPSDLTSS
jgi:hypothetical protein